MNEVLDLASRDVVSALVFLGLGLFQVVLSVALHRTTPSEAARALQSKYEAMPGDRRWRRRVRGNRRLIQQGDIKPDMCMVGGAMWCIASLIGLLAAVVA